MAFPPPPLPPEMVWPHSESFDSKIPKCVPSRPISYNLTCVEDIYRESKLSLDWLSRNLFIHTCPLLPAEPWFSHLMLASWFQEYCLFRKVSSPWGTYKYSSQYSEIQWIVYNTFVQHSSWRKFCREFHRKYPDSTVLCKAVIHNITTIFCSMESVLDKNKSQKDWRTTL
jgi:hypothetical protein